MHTAPAILLQIIEGSATQPAYKKTNGNTSDLHFPTQSLDRGTLRDYDNMSHAFLKDLYISQIPICWKHRSQFTEFHTKKLDRYKALSLLGFLFCEVALAQKK